MKIYARVLDGMVMELFSTDLDITTLFNPALVWVDVTDVSPTPVFGDSATETDGAWTFGGIVASEQALGRIS